MMLIQLTGMSGSGKTTLANRVREMLVEKGFRAEVIDGDTFRKKLWPDLGFSRADRNENIRRLGFIGNLLATNGIIVLLAAINPYEAIRIEISSYGDHVKTVWIDCDLETLIRRDTKQLYKRALLPDGHPDKIQNLSGVNDPYEPPENPSLIITTNNEPPETSAKKLLDYIINTMAL